MLTWLKLLPLELQGVERFSEPKEPVGANEEPLGILDDDLKRLWTLTQQLTKEAALAEVSRRFGEDENAGAKYEEYMIKVQALHSIFHVCVQDDFHLWGVDCLVAVRKGWVVTKSPRPQMPDMPPFFKRMFGGG